MFQNLAKDLEEHIPFHILVLPPLVFQNLAKDLEEHIPFHIGMGPPSFVPVY